VLRALPDDASWGERVDAHTAFHIALVDAAGSAQLNRLYPTMLQLCLAQLHSSYPGAWRGCAVAKAASCTTSSPRPRVAESVLSPLATRTGPSSSTCYDARSRPAAGESAGNDL
jgi:hypothetical protein